MTTRDATSSRAEVGELLLRLARRLRRQWSAELAPLGLNPHQTRALRIVESEGPLRLGQLAERLHITPRSVTEVVDALAAGHWVERVPDPADRRASMVRVTSAGRVQAQAATRAREQAAEDLLAGLSETEVNQLRLVLTRALDQ